MPVYHLTGPAPYFTNCFVLITEGGSGVVVDPAAPPEQIEELLQKWACPPCPMRRAGGSGWTN